jgi:hypothetical protein
MSMKNSNDTIGNRTCDLPDCIAVPQQTVLPRAPNTEVLIVVIIIVIIIILLLLFALNTRITAILKPIATERPSICCVWRGNSRFADRSVAT